MYVPIMIDAGSSQIMTMESSIDENTYNRIKLVYDQDARKGEGYIAQDSSISTGGGILQYFDALQRGKRAGKGPDALLQLTIRETRTLTVKGCRRRLTGCAVDRSSVVQLDLQ